jgi:thymidylate synthase (FAD)
MNNKTKLVWITPDAEKHIAYCARVSSAHQDNPEYEKLLTYCMKHGHWSVFEMAHMCIEISTSRAVATQILRHRSFSFQQHSLRYAEKQGFEFFEARRQDKSNRQNSIDDLPDEVRFEFLDMQQTITDMASKYYERALSLGVAKEQARFLLPLSVNSRMYMSGSIRSWIHYLKVRLDPSTQKEHRDIALEIYEILKAELPVIGKLIHLP